KEPRHSSSIFIEVHLQILEPASRSEMIVGFGGFSFSGTDHDNEDRFVCLPNLLHGQDGCTPSLPFDLKSEASLAFYLQDSSHDSSRVAVAARNVHFLFQGPLVGSSLAV